ncbi:MAG: glycoside hydrolase family 10 protein, partial [Anaerolineae bacterium]
MTRFNWAHSNPDTMKLRITEFMQQIAADNFNAVFFQVRGQAETLYPSPLEPWSKLVGARDPGFDPVALAIREARKHGLKFYAYINLLPLWNEESPPSAPDHLYFKHGPKVALQNSWLCFGEDGKPMRRNEYFYMNPALPAVKTYLKKVIHHFVSKYDIDGLHFDRIRYPGPNYLHDPFTLKYFRADSLRSPITKDEWARRQLTDLVEDVVAEALLIKPYLVNSAATWGLFHTVDMPDY